MKDMADAKAAAGRAWTPHSIIEWLKKNPMPQYEPAWNMSHVTDFQTRVILNRVVLEPAESRQ